MIFSPKKLRVHVHPVHPPFLRAWALKDQFDTFIYNLMANTQNLGITRLRNHFLTSIFNLTFHTYIYKVCLLGCEMI